MGWKQEWEKNWWSHWRWAYALCEDECSKATKEVAVIYEQWQPILINVKTLGDMGNKDATDSFFDLLEAMDYAHNYGDDDKGDYYVHRAWANTSQPYWDTLNE